MLINQGYLFIIFALNGVIIGLIFDFFRILRKTFNTSNLMTYFEDIMFWVLTGISIIFFMYNFSNGSIRLYMFLGLVFGILLYILTISTFIVKFMTKVILIIKNIVKNILNIVFKPIRFIYETLVKNLITLKELFFTKLSKKYDKNKYFSLKK